jgi:hypothetical protein
LGFAKASWSLSGFLSEIQELALRRNPYQSVEQSKIHHVAFPHGTNKYQEVRCVAKEKQVEKIDLPAVIVACHHRLQGLL